MKSNVRLSRQLIDAIKLDSRNNYEIAQEAGINSGLLSKWMCHISNVSPNDPRILKIGELLGIEPKHCFEKTANNRKRNQKKLIKRGRK